MGQQERERKLTNPNTLPAIHRTKGLSKSREELAGCGPAQPCWRQEAGGRGKGQARPQGPQPPPTAVQTGLQFLIKDLLRFWMVDIRREGPGETQGAGTRPARAGTGAGDGGQKARHTRGESAHQAPGCLSSSDGEDAKSRCSFLFQAFVEHPTAGTAHSAGPAPYRAARSLSSIEGKAAPAPPRSVTELAT